MKRITKIAIVVGSAISLGLAASAVVAHPFGYAMGWGAGHMGRGYYGGPGYAMGPGTMGGYGSGYGMGPGMMGGYGPAGWMGPGAMYNAYSGATDEGPAPATPQAGGGMGWAPWSSSYGQSQPDGGATDNSR